MVVPSDSNSGIGRRHETLIAGAITLAWQGGTDTVGMLLSHLLTHPLISYAALDLARTATSAARRIERSRDVASGGGAAPQVEPGSVDHSDDTRGAPTLIVVSNRDPGFPSDLAARGYGYLMEAALVDAVRLRGRLRVAGRDRALIGAPMQGSMRTMARLFTIVLARIEDEAALLRLERAPLVLASAAEVTHDLKNALVGLAGLLYLLKQELTAEHTAFDRATVVQEAIAQVTEIARRTVSLTRPAEVLLEPIDAAAVARDVLRIAEGWALPSHTMRIVSDPDVPLVVADRMLLQQAIGQLLQNALQAMPDGGAATVRVRRGATTTDGSTTPRARARMVRIEVADTGVGIPREDLERIFEPFVTTRGEEGSGIGLATVQRIAVLLRGALTVASEPGAGSTFTLNLPAHAETQMRT